METKLLKSECNKGFSLVEILVASFILFTSVVAVNAAYKQYVLIRSKQEKLQSIYISVLSLKDRLSMENLDLRPYGEGEINGLKYKYSAERVATSKKFFKDFSGKKREAFYLVLYRVKLNVAGKEFSFYKTAFRKAW